jgi:hypothetical protein
MFHFLLRDSRLAGLGMLSRIEVGDKVPSTCTSDVVCIPKTRTTFPRARGMPQGNIIWKALS